MSDLYGEWGVRWIGWTIQKKRPALVLLSTSKTVLAALAYSEKHSPLHLTLLYPLANNVVIPG